VGGAQAGHPPCPGRGQPHPDQPPVVVVAAPADQPEGLGPVGQLDGAVVADQEVRGQLADGRAAGVGVEAQDQQQLVLGRGQAGRGRLLLA
jgi:hypothetical protein